MLTWVGKQLDPQPSIVPILLPLQGQTSKNHPAGALSFTCLAPWLPFASLLSTSVLPDITSKLLPLGLLLVEVRLFTWSSKPEGQAGESKLLYRHPHVEASAQQVWTVYSGKQILQRVGRCARNATKHPCSPIGLHHATTNHSPPVYWWEGAFWSWTKIYQGPSPGGVFWGHEKIYGRVAGFDLRCGKPSLPKWLNSLHSQPLGEVARLCCRLDLVCSCKIEWMPPWIVDKGGECVAFCNQYFFLWVQITWQSVQAIPWEKGQKTVAWNLVEHFKAWPLPLLPVRKKVWFPTEVCFELHHEKRLVSKCKLGKLPHFAKVNVDPCIITSWWLRSWQAPNRKCIVSAAKVWNVHKKRGALNVQTTMLLFFWPRREKFCLRMHSGFEGTSFTPNAIIFPWYQMETNFPSFCVCRFCSSFTSGLRKCYNFQRPIEIFG